MIWYIKSSQFSKYNYYGSLRKLLAKNLVYFRNGIILPTFWIIEGLLYTIFKNILDENLKQTYSNIFANPYPCVSLLN